MQPKTYRLSLFVLILSLAASVTLDVHGQLFRRWRSVEPTQTAVCGPEGCVVYPSATVYQQRALLPTVQRTYIQPSPVATIDPAVLPTYTQASTVSTFATSGSLPAPTAEEVRSDFHRSFIKAVQSAARKGEINRVQALRLRAAMLMPAFRAQAEEMAVIQIVASGEESSGVEFGEGGEVSIDWDALLAFLEKLIPIILQLITIFSGMG